MFIIGTVGLSVLGNKKLGYVLYFIHIFSSVLYGYIIRNNAPKYITQNVNNQLTISNPFTASVRESAITSVIIGGYIVFFSVICELLIVFSPFKSDTLTALLCGFFEISNGVIMLSITTIPSPIKLALCSFIVSFSGMCITLQTLDMISELKISIKRYVISKLVIALISFALTYLLFSLFPPALNVFNDCSVAIKDYTGYIFWLAFIPTIIILLYQIKE